MGREKPPVKGPFYNLEVPAEARAWLKTVQLLPDHRFIEWIELESGLRVTLDQASDRQILMLANQIYMNTEAQRNQA